MNRTRLGMATLAAMLLAAGTVCGAQTPHPIRSLPKAPGDTSGTAPSTSDTPADPAPAAEPGTPIPALGIEALGATPGAAPAPQATTSSAPVTFSQPAQPAPTAGPARITATPLVSVTAAPDSSSAAPLPAPASFGPAPLRGSVMNSYPQDVPVLQRNQHYGPFSAVALQIKGGFAGVGVDVATPLAQRLNLRVGASFFQYSGSFNVDGTQVDGEVKFRSGTVQFDIFPFGGGFRISPGVTVYNGNNLNANAFVPSGTQFDLGDATFTSSPTDPVHGTAAMTFGNRTAPSITVGWGNMIPRSGRHWSIPFEIGIQYIQDPKLSLNLSGTACGVSGSNSGCEQVQSDPDIQQDIKDEEDQINSDIRPLRFYPIISIGFAWAFHLGKH